MGLLGLGKDTESYSPSCISLGMQLRHRPPHLPSRHHHRPQTDSDTYCAVFPTFAFLDSFYYFGLGDKAVGIAEVDDDQVFLVSLERAFIFPDILFPEGRWRRELKLKDRQEV